MKVCYLFWGRVARLFKPHAQRPDEITANLCQLCIELCFEGMHDSLSQVRSQQLKQHISTKQSSWMDGHCWSLSLDCLQFELPTSLTRPVEAFSLQPTIQSHGHKIAKCHRGGRRARRAGEDNLSIPDTQGDYLDWSCSLGTRFPEWVYILTEENTCTYPWKSKTIKE